MEITDMSAYMSMFKDVKRIWDKMAGSDKDKIDQVARSLADKLVTDERLARQKDFFVKGTDPLPMRLVGLYADKEVRARIQALREANKPPSMPETIAVKCPFCEQVAAYDTQTEV